jgi:hypothetical protein
MQDIPLSPEERANALAGKFSLVFRQAELASPAHEGRHGGQERLGPSDLRDGGPFAGANVSFAGGQGQVDISLLTSA